MEKFPKIDVFPRIMSIGRRVCHVFNLPPASHGNHFLDDLDSYIHPLDTPLEPVRCLPEAPNWQRNALANSGFERWKAHHLPEDIYDPELRAWDVVGPQRDQT